MTITAHQAQPPARGSSMFPFVPSGSRLSVRAPDSQAIEVGDIIAYVGDATKPWRLTTHRVVQIERDGGETWYTARGDARRRAERVAHSDVIEVVTRVSFRGISYDTRGWFGRTTARIALRHGLGLRAAHALGRAALAAQSLLSVQSRVRG